MRKMSGQRMEGAALIVQTEHAVMVVSMGFATVGLAAGCPWAAIGAASYTFSVWSQIKGTTPAT